MKYYIEIGKDAGNAEFSKRMKSWTGWEHADVIITVLAPDADIRQSASGTQKTFKESLDWLVEKVQRLWPEDV